MKLVLSLAKAQKPYGHTAYTRRTRTGKLVLVAARGVKPTEEVSREIKVTGSNPYNSQEGDDDDDEHIYHDIATSW